MRGRFHARFCALASANLPGGKWARKLRACNGYYRFGEVIAGGNACSKPEEAARFAARAVRRPKKTDWRRSECLGYRHCVNFLQVSELLRHFLSSAMIFVWA